MASLNVPGFSCYPASKYPQKRIFQEFLIFPFPTPLKLEITKKSKIYLEMFYLKDIHHIPYTTMGGDSSAIWIRIMLIIDHQNDQFFAPEAVKMAKIRKNTKIRLPWQRLVSMTNGTPNLCRWVVMHLWCKFEENR